MLIELALSLLLVKIVDEIFMLNEPKLIVAESKCKSSTSESSYLRKILLTSSLISIFDQFLLNEIWYPFSEFFTE